MKLNVFQEKFDSLFPLSAGEEWDLNGVFLGNYNRVIKKVMVCLDVNLRTLNTAINNSVDLIVAHHPISFNPNIEEAMAENDINDLIIKRLKKANIAVFIAHTNVDVAKNGMNDWLAEKISLLNPKPICSNGLGRIGKVVKPAPMSQIVNKIQRTFKVESIRTGYYNEELEVKNVAIIGGSGGDHIIDCIKKDADLIVTSDLKWHHWQLADAEKITVIDVGHYMESIFVDKIAEVIEKMKLEVYTDKDEDLVKFRSLDLLH